jgi:hypothetical protein
MLHITMLASLGIFGITPLCEIFLSVDGKDELLAAFDADKNFGR